MITHSHFSTVASGKNRTRSSSLYPIVYVKLNLATTAEDVTPSDIQIATLFSSSAGSMYVYGTSRVLFLALMSELKFFSSS